MSERLPVVGVMGSGSEPHAERASAVGRWLAREGVHLLTGGGGGVMEAASRAFSEVGGRRGLVIGVLPSSVSPGPPAPPAGYPNPWVEIALHTHLPLLGAHGRDPLSRNHINVLSADVLIALPGGAGTASEVALALAYDRPLVAWLASRDEIPDLPAGAETTASFEGVQTYVRVALGALC